MDKSNYQIIIDLIKEFSGQRNVISIPRIFITLTGDIVIALFLSQCVWWSDKSSHPDGGFWKSAKAWKREIGLSYSQIKRCEKILKKKGILRTALRRANGAPTTHYYLNMEILANLILEKVENRKSCKSDFRESQKTITALTTAPTKDEGDREKSPSPSISATTELPTAERQMDILFPSRGSANIRDYERSIIQSGWVIYSDDIRQAAASFLQASGLPIPGDSSTRKGWIKALKQHVNDFGIGLLIEMYPRAIEKLTGLTIGGPWSVTKTLPSVVRRSMPKQQFVEYELPEFVK